MARPRKLTAPQQFNLRMPVEIVGRIDRHLERMKAATPGLTLSRSDVFRIVVTRGLDDLEREAGERPKKR